VPYWELISSSFRITWRHKYLWLLALFAGEGSGGFNFSYQSPAPLGPGGSPGSGPDFSSIPRQASDWLGQHLSLVLAALVLVLLLAIAFFVLAAVCEGALVRASAEHDAARPFGLRIAWRCGVMTMGSIIRFRLLLIALALPLLIVFFALLAGFIAAIATHNVGPAVALGLTGALVILAAIPYAIYLNLIGRLGARAVVLEQVGARAAVLRGHRLVFKRLGRVLLVWLLSIAVAIALGICTAVALAIVAVPAFLFGIAAFTTGSPVLWLVVAILALILVPVALTVQGFSLAQGSTFWTLAFRRLEIDQAPVYGYPYQPSGPPQATT
jgi:hypothetical protein